METTLVQRIFSQRILLLILSFALIILSNMGLQRLTFDGSTEFFFGEQHPNMVKWREFGNTYGSPNRALMMLRSKDGSSLLTHTKYLQALEETTAKLEQIKHIIRVESLSNYQHSWSQGDELFVEPLFEHAKNLNPEQLQNIQQIAASDPALLKRLVSENADTLVIIMAGAFDEKNGDVELQKLAMATKIYALQDELRLQYPTLNVEINGNIIGNAVTMKMVMEDIKFSIPLMYVIIYGLLALLLRSVLSMLTIAITATICTTSSLGIACWAGITLSPLSLSSVSIIVITTVAHCVHIVIAFQESYRSGNDKINALKESYRINLQPIFFTSITTALGFLSMNISEMQPARDLGNIVAIGVVISFVLSLTLLPTFLLMMPINNKNQQASALTRISQILSAFVIQHSGKLLLSSFIVASTLAWLASTNTITERMTENIKYPHPFRLSVDAYDKAIGGIYTLQYSLSANEENGISNPDYLQHLESFSQWLRQQPEVDNVYTYTDIIKRLNRNMHGDQPAFFSIPESRELAAQYLLLYEFSLPAGQDLSNQINQDRSASRLIISISSMDAVSLIALQDKIFQWQQIHLPKTMQDYGTSPAIMWSHLSINVLKNSLLSAFTALFLISIVLMGILRSFKYGLISLAPNMLPGIAGFGFWAIYSSEINLALMSVLSITIGIVVDDTVHFLSKYMRAKKEQGLNTEQAVAYAFQQVGPAIITTTLVLVAGFGSLSFSPFLANSNMGIIIAVIIFAALLYDFFLLPALLLVLDKTKPQARL